MKKLVVFLTDPMKTYYQKGEIKERYYNPSNFFDEVHIISFCNRDIEEHKVKEVVGNASLFIYPIGKIKIFSLPFLLINILNLLKKISPDVVRAYDPSLRGAIAVWCGNRIKAPTVVSVHADLDEERKFRRELRLNIRRVLERYSLTNADKVICVSKYLVRYVKRYGAKDIAVIYNKVDTDRFINNKKRYFVKEVVSVGRLDRQKYQECLIRAIKDINMNLTLVGQGELYEELRSLVINLNLVEKVKFIKSVPHGIIHSYYTNADIFAIATHYEGFCIPLVEAMAAGIPVVASDIPPIREIVGDAGILLENKPDLFKDAFIRLQENPDLYIKLIDKGRKRSMQFDSRIIEKQEKDLYQSLINN